MTNQFYDKHYEVCFKSKKNFVNFIKINTDDYSDKDLKEIEFLAQRVAENMYLYPRNINTAKSDYIALLGALVRNGILFEKHKNLKPKTDYPD